jgi:hypothetical protein
MLIYDWRLDLHHVYEGDYLPFEWIFEEELKFSEIERRSELGPQIIEYH